MKPIRFAWSSRSALAQLCCASPKLRPATVLASRRLNTSQTENQDSGSRSHQSKRKFHFATATAAALGAGGLVLSLVRAERRPQALTWTKAKSPSQESGQPRETRAERPPRTSAIETERRFTREEVAQHDSLDKGVWITYKGGVYDISQFVRHHPGGSHTILMGAGGDVEPFWQTYTVHHAHEVQRLLSEYKIGQLTEEEQQLEAARASQADGRPAEDNPYAGDPARSPLLEVLSRQPFNAETPARLLTPTYLTPADIFFVRNHLPVPEVHADEYTLTICVGSDGDPDGLQVLAELTLAELKSRFEPHSVDSVIQCSGNRRSDLRRLKEIKGLDWGVGAISNARWTGVRLVDLLDQLGVDYRELKVHEQPIRHVQLEGLDCDMTGQSYGASVGADLAFDRSREVLLAYEMNGQPLTRDHGHPLRFVAPGVTGARNVKWLSRIILSHEESHSHWQRRDYKSFSPNVDMFSLDFDQSASIQETPVQSAICEPQDGDQRVPVGRRPDTGETFVPVRGYAYSGGGKMIVRVDVSADGGKSWHTAHLEDVPRDQRGLPDWTKRNQVFAWTRWSCELPIEAQAQHNKSSGPSTGRQVKILCRAFDSSYNSQPERAETIWNVRGVVNNSWHQVQVGLDEGA